MKISVVIPAHNEEKYIADCLASVEKHRTSNVLEVIVIDNASTDRTAEVAAKFPGVRVVHEPAKGLTKARARALAEAKGDIVANIDADTRVPAGYFERITKAYEKNKNLVCFSGPYVYYDLSKAKNLGVWIYWNLTGRLTYWIVGYMAVGGNFAAKREALHKIGGFDTSIAFYGEDTNIARRLSKVGKVKFDNGAFIYTSGRRLAKEGVITMAVKYGSNYFSEVFFKRQALKEYKDIR